MKRSWDPTPSGRNFVRTNRGQRGQVVYEQPPSGSYNQPFTGYTGMAADHIRRQQEYERARQTDAYEEARQRYREEQELMRQWYEQREQQKTQKQSPKRRSKSPSPQKKRSASLSSPEPPEGIERDTGPKPPNCESFKKYPVRPIGDKKTKKIQFRRQLLLFHPDKNIGCSKKADKKTVLLYKYKDEDPMFAGGKSKRKSKRASKRTTKKRSGK
jgi:hypothetical protein